MSEPLTDEQIRELAASECESCGYPLDADGACSFGACETETTRPRDTGTTLADARRAYRRLPDIVPAWEIDHDALD